MFTMMHSLTIVWLIQLMGTSRFVYASTTSFWATEDVLMGEMQVCKRSERLCT